MDARDARRTGAEERLAAFGRQLERIGLDDFRLMALSPMAAEDRATARRAGERRAQEAGLGDLVADVRAGVRTHMDRVYTSGGYHPTWVTINWGLSTGPVEDRVAATAAVEDAALAAVIDGLAEDDVVATLRGPFELIATVHPMPTGGDALPGVDDLRRVGPLGAALLVVVFLVVIAGLASGPWGVAIAAVVVIAAVAVGSWRTRRPPR